MYLIHVEKFNVHKCRCFGLRNIRIYRVAQKSKPLPNDQKIVLNRIKACQWDEIYS